MQLLENHFMDNVTFLFTFTCCRQCIKEILKTKNVVRKLQHNNCIKNPLLKSLDYIFNI